MSPIVLLSLVAFWYWRGSHGNDSRRTSGSHNEDLARSDERTLPIAIMLSKIRHYLWTTTIRFPSVETLSSDDSETLCNPLVESEKNSSSIDHLPPF